MITASQALNILIVEDNPSDYILFKEFLRLTGLPVKQVSHVERLQQALNLLPGMQPDLVFLDLSLPDSEGLDTFTRINAVANHISVIVLSGLSDMQVALNTIGMGAQDYLVKGEYNELLLAKSIQYSMERKKILQKVVESYERYNTIIKATNDTIWDWDLRTNEILWNEGICSIFGYAPDQVLNTIEWHNEKIHPADRDRVLQHIADCLRDGKDHWEEEYRYTAANGNYRYVFDRGYILKTDQQVPYRMLGAMMDITERKLMQEELVKSQLETQKLITQVTIQTQEQERREIGLELHDNINQILATAKLCMDMVMNEKVMRKELLHKSYDSISKAIHEIRVLSKNLVPPSLRDIGLKEALLELIENIALSQDLRIRIDAMDPLIENTSGNKKLIIYRIVQEQVNNILKHSKATEACIEIKTIKNILHLSIIDNGIGFDPKKKTSGIGLNNIISRVEMQNGTMDIISSAGKGCTLHIEMPV